MAPAGAAPAAAGAPIAVKVGHVNPPGDPSHDAWEFFKKTLEEKSGGKFKVDLYPAGQLGEERELIEQAKMGSVDLVTVNSAPLSLHFPKFDLFVLPYLFRDEPHLRRFADGPVGQKLAEDFEKATNIKLIGILGERRPPHVPPQEGHQHPRRLQGREGPCHEQRGLHRPLQRPGRHAHPDGLR